MEDSVLLDELGKVHKSVDSAKDTIMGEVRDLGERVTRVETKLDVGHKPPCDALANLESHYDEHVKEERQSGRDWRLWALGIVGTLITAGIVAVFGLLR
jgi:hypothetical protein